MDEIPLSRPKRNISRDFSDGAFFAMVAAAGEAVGLSVRWAGRCSPPSAQAEERARTPGGAGRGRYLPPRRFEPCSAPSPSSSRSHRVCFKRAQAPRSAVAATPPLTRPRITRTLRRGFLAPRSQSPFPISVQSPWPGVRALTNAHRKLTPTCVVPLSSPNTNTQHRHPCLLPPPNMTAQASWWRS